MEVVTLTNADALPSDWRVVPLGKMLKQPPAYGINARSIPLDSRHPTYIRITDITADGRFADSTKASVSHPTAAQYKLEDGDLVFARTGASVGKSYLYSRHDGELVFAGFLIRISPNTNELFPAYLAQFVKTKQYWAWVKQTSMRSGQPGINGQEYASLPVPLPPTKPEQEVIALALSDADAYVESLEDLIAKKRLVKQGAMQELLTGKRRLLGFTGEWTLKRLEEIADIAMGATPPRLTKSYWGKGFKWLSIADLTRKAVHESAEEITQAAAARMQVIRRGTLLMSFKLSIGRLAFAGCDLYTNEAICNFTNLRANAEFLYYSLGTTDFSLYGKLAVKGYTLNKESLKSVEILLPSLDEQVAIASVLSDMDAEIAEYEVKLNKARDVKQGMMQNLLTGKVRLV